MRPTAACLVIFLVAASAVAGGSPLVSTDAPPPPPAREIFVTNTRDVGEGSLRGAIEEANAVCTPGSSPCRILLRIEEPVPESGSFTIRPLTPLPPITASDFVLQPVRGYALAGHELDGSLLLTGHGLEVAGEGAWQVTDLVIGGFPWDGVHVTRRGPAGSPVHRYPLSGVAHLTLGTHYDGKGNRNRRGISFDLPAENASVAACEIAGNHRSGIFINGGTRIAVASTGLSYNGAGIFVGPDASDVHIMETGLEWNAEFGVAIARGARKVRIEDSLIRHHTIQDIDHGLDGFSGYVSEGTDPAISNLPAPHLTSATYDPLTNRTTVTGTFDAPQPDQQWKLTLYFLRWAWPEERIPTVVFTGRRFTFTVTDQLTEPMSVTVDSVAELEWSTSEKSEPITSP
jgi:hypothetical protein